jgi:serine/threonine-protein kinase
VVAVEQLDPKYEVVRKLREGGMGTIYLVRHRLLEELRVIKVLRSQLTSDEDLKQRFLREAKTAILLRHPNIAQLYDFSIDVEGNAYIVMEYIDGVTLEEWESDRPGIDLAETLAIAHQALRALGFLHRKGYVHRDVSPDNLMLTRDTEGQPLVKLIDLGIVKILRSEQKGTATALYLGKPKYSSPEQLVSPQVDARSDLYSFGVMLYELVTGKFPISGGDLPSLITGHLHVPPLDFAISDPKGRVPPLLRQLLLDSLAKEPAGRPKSAEEFGRRLAEVERELARGMTLVAPPDAARLERLLADAEIALADRRLPEALSKVTEVLLASPGEPRALALQSRIEAAFAAQPPVDESATQPPRKLPEPAPGSRPEARAETRPEPGPETTARRRLPRWALAAAGLAVAAVAVAVALLARGGDRTPPEYGQGLGSLARHDLATAIQQLRTAAGKDPLERDDYLPFLHLGLALAESGDCEAAESAFTTSIGQGKVQRSARFGEIAGARAACARAGLGPELRDLDAKLADLEAKVRELDADRRDPNLATLWSDPALGRELDGVSALLVEARNLAASARARGDRGPLFEAQDRFADAQSKLGALLKKIAPSR